jgi:hypothetical protein
MFGNRPLNKPGNYSEIFTNSNGCDSVVILDLTTKPSYIVAENITITDTENYLGWTVEGTYRRNLISSAGCDSLIVTNLKIRENVLQKISLEKGWNIFSSFVAPSNNYLDSVLGELVKNGKLIQVHDESYNIYEKQDGQESWVNNIGKLEQSEGYRISVNSDCDLDISGVQIKLPLNIEIRKGLNLISFPLNESIDAMQVMEPIIRSGIIDKIQDEKGRSIENWGEFGWINGIGNFNPGDGYIIYANDNGVLTINQTSDKSQLIYSKNVESGHFNPVFEGNGLEHMNINIMGLKNIDLTQGDEIAVFDENNCVGFVKLDIEQMGINAVSIPASASEDKVLNGFTEGKPIELKVWQEKSNREFKLYTMPIKGEMKYKKHGSVFLKITDKLNSTEDIIVYPNPATSKVFVQFSSLPEEGATIYLMNVSGEQILIQEVQSHIETLNIENLPSGIYFIKAYFNNMYSNYKLLIL